MPRNRQRGFTLIEATITLAVIALAAAVIIPAMNNASRAELRRAASQVSATVRSTFDDAALTGNTERIVFDLKEGKLRVEATEEVLNFDPDTNTLVRSMQLSDDLSSVMAPELLDNPEAEKDASKDKNDKKKASKEPPEAKPNGAMVALFGVNKLAGKHGGADPTFESKGTLQLDGSVHITDIWTEGMRQPATEGEIYLVFFPGGYTQDAMVHLRDDEGRAFTVRVAALTGKTRIEDGYTEVPR